MFALHEIPHLAAPATAYAGWDGQAWVVERPGGGGGLLATIGVKPSSGGGAELCQLYVHRMARNAGLGRALVDLVEETATNDLAARWIHLWSDTRFLDAHRLYERTGYERLAETRLLDDLSATEEQHFRKTVLIR